MERVQQTPGSWHWSELQGGIFALGDITKRPFAELLSFFSFHHKLLLCRIVVQTDVWSGWLASPSASEAEKVSCETALRLDLTQ